MSTTKKLLESKSSRSGLERREYGQRNLWHWPCNTLYLKKLALASPTSGGRSVGIVRSLTQATELIYIQNMWEKVFLLKYCYVHVYWQ
jgi:hypothetical protein